MKYFLLLISLANTYFGMRCFLNAIHVLHTSKYSQTSTVIFAILFLGMGAAGCYFSLFRNDLKLAFLIAVGPWVLALAILLINMLTSRYP